MSKTDQKSKLSKGQALEILQAAVSEIQAAGWHILIKNTTGNDWHPARDPGDHILVILVSGARENNGQLVLADQNAINGSDQVPA